jgi:predicted transcriptional regulator
MLEALITSKTRLKLLIKFFVSTGNSGYLRGLAGEFDESTNSIRKELNQLTEAGYLQRKQEQKKILYKANTTHPLFHPVQRLVRSFLGIEDAIDKVMERAGDVQQVILTGSYAKGIESDTMEITILGKDLDVAYLLQLGEKTSKLIGKTVKIALDKPKEG